MIGHGMIRIGFSGSRSIKELNALDKYFIEIADVVIHGGAIGYDTLVNDYAKGLGKEIFVFRPSNPSIASDYFKRNKQIVNNSDIMHFNGDGVSKGTKLTLDLYIKKVGKKGQ